MVFIPVHISILLPYQFVFRNIVIPEATTVPCMTTSSFLSHKMTYFENIINHNQEVAHFIHWFSNQNVIRHHKLDKLCLRTTPKSRHCPLFCFYSFKFSLRTTGGAILFPLCRSVKLLVHTFSFFCKGKELEENKWVGFNLGQLSQRKLQAHLPL